jgi:aspartate ammonia-lyase
MAYAVGTFASRAAVMSGNAVALAAGKVRAKALRIAADALEVATDDLEVADFVEVLVRSQSTRRMGSAALNLCYVACGRFDAYFATIKEDVARLKEAAALFCEVNLGATAIGTGINADPRYAALAVEELARLARQPLVPASNLIEATSDMGAFVFFSGVLKRVAVKLSKICNDLRLLSSGPRAGFGEIRLPAVQAGSDHAGNNPVIPEVVQVAFMVVGRPHRDYAPRRAVAQRLRADHRLLHPVVASLSRRGRDDLDEALCCGDRGGP